MKKDFEKLLKHGGLDAHRWMKATDSTVARVYDRNLEQLELTVDLYSSYARIVDYSASGFTSDEVVEIKDIVSRFLYIPLQNVIFTERKKREGREQHEKKEVSTPVIVRENGLEFETELSLYTDTGLFFDQVNTRSLVRNSSIGRKVLNLFCYTGSFSVYAADGGAESVTSVDLSNVYSEWAIRNLDRNGFLDRSKYNVVTMDAKRFLEDTSKDNKRYDLVIFDPPAFSNSHKADDFDVQKDYLWFLGAISKILSKDGAVVFSENLSGFRFDKGALSPYYNVKEITREVLAPGFSAKRKQLRVWILEKTATMKDEYMAVRKRIKMSDELKDESLERLTLADEKDFGKVERRERRDDRKGPRSFDFDRRDSDSRRDGQRRGERRDTHQRDHERRSSRDMRDRYNDRDRDDRRSYSRDDRRSSYSRDDRRPRDFDSRDRRSFGDRDDRRRDDYRDRRRDDYSDRRDYPRRDFDSRDRRDRFDSDRDRRAPRQGERREGNFRSQGRDRWDNDTSRFYRGEREERRSSYSSDAPRKKTSKPKPYGYDSFMETKNREKATAFWLQGQEGKKSFDDEDR